MASFTPKAFARSSPGLEQPWVDKENGESNAESVGEQLFYGIANAFSVVLPAVW